MRKPSKLEELGYWPLGIAIATAEFNRESRIKLSYSVVRRSGWRWFLAGLVFVAVLKLVVEWAT